MRNNDRVSFLAPFFRGGKQERSEQLRPDANMEDKREPQPFRRTGEGFLLGTALMVLAACGSSSFLVLSGSVANFIQTDKLPTDYVAEWASGKECRALVAMKDGGPLCRKTFDAPRNMKNRFIAIERSVPLLVTMSPTPTAPVHRGFGNMIMPACFIPTGPATKWTDTGREGAIR